MPKYKKESRPGIANADSGGRAAKNISGGYGPHKGSKEMSYPKDMYKKRKGYSDYGDGYSKMRYEDGGVVESLETQAKRAAVQKLREFMSNQGGQGLKQNFENGGIVAKVSAPDPKGLVEGLEKAAQIMKDRTEMDHDYDEMTKEELIEMLKNR